MVASTFRLSLGSCFVFRSLCAHILHAQDSGKGLDVDREAGMDSGICG